MPCMQFKIRLHIEWKWEDCPNFPQALLYLVYMLSLIELNQLTKQQHLFTITLSHLPQINQGVKSHSNAQSEAGKSVPGWLGGLQGSLIYSFHFSILIGQLGMSNKNCGCLDWFCTSLLQFSSYLSTSHRHTLMHYNYYSTCFIHQLPDLANERIRSNCLSCKTSFDWIKCC